MISLQFTSLFIMALSQTHFHYICLVPYNLLFSHLYHNTTVKYLTLILLCYL